MTALYQFEYTQHQKKKDVISWVIYLFILISNSNRLSAVQIGLQS